MSHKILKAGRHQFVVKRRRQVKQNKEGLQEVAPRKPAQGEGSMIKEKKQDEIAIKAKAHIQYTRKSGEIVPGVTTILNSVLAKPALVPWAWNLGRQGIDWRAYKDKAAEIGKIAHYLLLCHFKNEKPILDEYSPADVDKAENCLLSYFSWEKGKKIEPIFVEKAFVSENYGYGGTLDFYGKIDGVLTLLDAKTSKAIYDEMIFQCGAYFQLLVENGYDVAQTRIIRIGRGEDEGFEDRAIGNISTAIDIFMACLDIYNLKKQMKKGG